jgi:hypothetical protein
VECGGASTTSAGAWHLGLLRGWDEGDAASAWLTHVLNLHDRPAASSKEAPGGRAVAEFRLVRAAAVRALATYAGPTQAPFGTDVAAQRRGDASPFRMQHVPVRAHGARAGERTAPFSLFLLFPPAPLPRTLLVWEMHPIGVQ